MACLTFLVCWLLVKQSGKHFCLASRHELAKSTIRYKIEALLHPQKNPSNHSEV